MDLTDLSNETLGELCRAARLRSGEGLRDVAALADVSHVTVLAWERRSDSRLVEFWRGRGFRFPEEFVRTRVHRIGKDRVLALGHPIVDHGVTADWSGMKFKRVNRQVLRPLDEHEYAVNEAVGTYWFSPMLHGRRSVIVDFTRP